MITTTDIGKILYLDCRAFGIAEIYRAGDIPPVRSGSEYRLETERVNILPKSQSLGKYWRKSFVEVNLCVPDIGEDTANIIRLNELERQAMSVLDGVHGKYDGTPYRYSIESIGMEEDTSLKCHYMNVRILFEVLNVKL